MLWSLYAIPPYKSFQHARKLCFPFIISSDYDSVIYWRTQLISILSCLRMRRSNLLKKVIWCCIVIMWLSLLLRLQLHIKRSKAKIWKLMFPNGMSAVIRIWSWNISREAQLDYKLENKSHDEEHYKNQKQKEQSNCRLFIQQIHIYWHISVLITVIRNYRTVMKSESCANLITVFNTEMCQWIWICRINNLQFGCSFCFWFL